MTPYSLTEARKRLRNEVRELAEEKRKLLWEIGELQNLRGKVVDTTEANANFLITKTKQLEKLL